MRRLNSQNIFDKSLIHHDFVLLYQMTKAGISSIESSLEKANIPSWLIHNFGDCEEFPIYQNTNGVNCFFDWHIRTKYKFLLNYRCRVLQKRDYLKIITLVQDPIATVVTLGRDILLMKVEALDKLAPILANCLEQPQFNLVSNHNAKNKWYSELYQLFIKTCSFEQLFHLYQSTIYQAIYSKKEINQFKEKWNSM